MARTRSCSAHCFFLWVWAVDASSSRPAAPDRASPMAGSRRAIWDAMAGSRAACDDGFVCVRRAGGVGSRESHPVSFPRRARAIELPRLLPASHVPAGGSTSAASLISLAYVYLRSPCVLWAYDRLTYAIISSKSRLRMPYAWQRATRSCIISLDLSNPPDGVCTAWSVRARSVSKGNQILIKI
jgi:hypothetical protein